MTSESDATVATDQSSGRGGRIATIGTLISAVLASSCCWLPLLLLAVGVSATGIATTLGQYRWIFMTVTFAFLGMAFYFTYRPRKASATAGDCCTPEAGCCGPQAGADGASKKRISMMSVNKVMLWVVTVFALAFLFFPKYLTSMLIADGGEFTDDMTLTEFKVGGMWCEGCVPTAEKTIREVPGVLAVKVDYDTGIATVGTAAGAAAPNEEIVASLAAVEFPAELKEP